MNEEKQKIEIIENRNGSTEEIRMILEAVTSFISQIPEKEQLALDTKLKNKEIAKQMKAEEMMHIEKVDRTEKIYTFLIIAFILAAIFIFKKFEIVDDEKISLSYLLLMTFAFANVGRFLKSVSKNSKKTNG